MLPASEAVTAVTDYSSSSPLFFGRRVIDVQSAKRRPPTTALSKKLHSLPSSIRRIIEPRATPAWTQDQVVVRPTQSCEKIDRRCPPVSALIYACMLEL